MTEIRTRTRLKILAGLVVFMFAALTTRLWFLQVLASDQFAALANQNQVRLVPIDPLRGLILDRRGDTIVGNRASAVVTVDRAAMAPHEESVLYNLSKVLNTPVPELVRSLASNKYLPYQPVPVAFDVTPQQIFYIQEHQSQFPGVSYEQQAVRDYPDGTDAAHVLGYVGHISSEQLAEKAFANYTQQDEVGRAGLEAVYERYLHGTPGVREVQVNARGDVLDENFGGEAPQAGDNLVLSIDDRVQKLTESSLNLGIALACHLREKGSGFLKATGGAAVVLDPRNGQVLALASNPTFNPGLFTGGLSNKEALGLDLCPVPPACPKPSHGYPLFDKAVQGRYPAGSTFKPFVALAALHDHIAKTNGTYACPPTYIVPGDISKHPFHNWTTANFGFIDLPRALVISCDTVFYQFGYNFYLRFLHSHFTDEVMQHDLVRMGFGRDTGIDLPPGTETEGVVPTADYKHKLFASAPRVYGTDSRWYPGDNVNLAIGQGFLQVTPLQLATAYGAIANGGTLYAPRLAWKIQRPDGRTIATIKPRSMGRLPDTPKQVAFIRNALTGVPGPGGTAGAAFAGFPLSQIPVAGKTGTADVAGQQPTSWFACMAPADHPRFVVVVLVEQGGHGATTAAPIARRILEGLFGMDTSGPLHLGIVAD